MESIHVLISYPYHPELRGDQVCIFHSSVESQDTIGAPAEQHGLKRSVGVELQRGKDSEGNSRRDKHGKRKRERGSEQE